VRGVERERCASRRRVGLRGIAISEGSTAADGGVAPTRRSGWGSNAWCWEGTPWGRGR
jgi:hypothetical protein